MSSSGPACEANPDPTPEAPGPTDRVGAFETDDGFVVIYEDRQANGWIKSDTAFPLAGCR